MPDSDPPPAASSLDQSNEVAVYRAKRKVLRTAITKDFNKVKELGEVTTDNQMEARVLLAKMEKEGEQVSACDDYILRNDTNTDQITAEIEHAMDYQMKLTEAISRLTIQLQMIQQQSVAATAAASQAEPAKRSNIRTPKLELTTFEGDPLRWDEFWDDFSCSVDAREDLSTIDKFKILKQSLRGEALRVADGYYLTQNNYEEVKEVLKDRFGDPQVAIFAHFEALLEVKPASHDVQDLVKMRDFCEAHIRGLVALGVAEDTFGLVFAPILLSKLPRFVRMELNRKNTTNKWTLSTLRERLKEEIDARTKSDRSFAGSSGNSADRVKKDQGTRKKGSPGTATALVVQSESKSGKKRNGKPRGCVFCEGQHRNWECSRYPTVDARQPQIKGRCFLCFSDKHMMSSCDNVRPCYYCNKKNHNSSLCFERFGKPRHGRDSAHVCLVDRPLNPEAPEFVSANALQHEQKSGSAGGTAVFESAMVDIIGRKCRMNVRVVLDTASSGSLIRQKVSRKIGAAPTGDRYASLSGVGQEEGKFGKYPKVGLKLVLRDGSTMYIEAREIEHVAAPLKLVPLELHRSGSGLEQHELAELLVTEPTSAEIDMLLGLDVYYQLVGQELGRTHNGLVIKDTRIGKIVTGYKKGAESAPQDVQVMFTFETPAQLPDMPAIENFWRLENIGILDKPDVNEDDAAMELFNKKIEFKDGRYFMEFPLKVDRPELPSTRDLAVRQLRSGYRRLEGNPQLLSQYNQIFNDQLAKGVIEPAPEKPSGQVHYVPHHAVVTPGKETTKVRIVFNGSARPFKNAQSLNDAMYRGPVFLNDLCGMLLRFRLRQKAVITDVEKAFLQLCLHTSHRDLTRFVWLKDPNKPPTDDNIIEFRYTRVPFGMKASPFLLAATILYHLRKAATEMAKCMERNTYIDNIFGGCDTAAEARQYYRDAKQLFSEMSMNLREWYCNDQEFMDSLPEADKGKSQEPTVLGLRWNLADDTVRCCSQEMQVGPVTKRAILKSCASLFDPCGWFCPLSIRGKMLLQDLWKQKFDWDKLVEGRMAETWLAIERDLADIPTCVLPRLYSLPLTTRLVDGFELHAFSDASEKAFAACVYLRVEGTDGAHTALVFAKARVAPVKQLTVPKLELTAAVIGVRLLNFVAKELMVPVKEKHLWVDSTCVIKWLNSDNVNTVYVENRLREIRACQDITVSYVPSRQNPADLPTRGLMSLAELRTSKLWWCGPDWLAQPKDVWPKKETTQPRIVPLETTASESYQTVLEAKQPQDSVFDVDRYSTLDRLLRVTATVFKAVDRLKGGSPEAKCTAKDMDHALKFWEKRVQAMYFSHLFTDAPLPAKVENLKKQLQLFVDENGYIRCRGRFQNSPVLSSMTKYPKLLPSHSAFTDLVIKRFHERVHHSGPKHTLAMSRTTYWICQGRSQVRRVLWNCLVCRRHEGGPFEYPTMSPLPDLRSDIQRPFECVGLDYLGPLFVRNDGCAEVKVWIALFTCATTRAIHLEVVPNLTAQEFLLALRRFTSMCGLPRVIVCDNAKQFKLADQVLTRMWRDVVTDESVVEYSATKGIEWRYITEHAPWMGGFYERLVGSVKKALKKTIGGWKLTHVELVTICHEVASVLNTRPLVYSDDDPSECVITPAHLLFRSPSMFPDDPVEPGPIEDRTSKAEELMTHWRSGQKLLREFWDVWKGEYLLSLREYWKPIQDRGTSDIPAKVGAVVLIKDELPRGLWKVGRVEELRRSHDGQVRSAVVRLANKNAVNRPLRLLYPIEGGSGDDVPCEQDAIRRERSSQKATAKRDDQPLRPQRRAAVASRAKTHQMLQD